MIFGSFGRVPRGRSRTRETGGPAGRVILVLFLGNFFMQGEWVVDGAIFSFAW